VVDLTVPVHRTGVTSQVTTESPPSAPSKHHGVMDFEGDLSTIE